MNHLFRKATDKEWDEIVQNNNSATFFHTRVWYEIIARNFGFNVETKLLEFARGVRVLLPLASSKIFKGLAQRYISSPLGTYGGFLSDSGLLEEEKEVHYKCLFSIKNLVLRENPYNELISDFKGYTKEDFTQVIDLERPNNVLIAGMNKEQVPRKVRQAERCQLQLRKIGEECIGNYYEIYKNCRQRWGGATNNYALAFFKDLCGVKNCDFWGVFTADNELICGGLFLKNNRHVVSWLSIAATRALAMKPYEYLYFNLIFHYKEQGYKWFDFNPSGGHEGVVKFKAGFGAKKRNVREYVSRFILKKAIGYINRIFNV